MTYDEIKKHAIAKCDEWFLSNPVYFHNKAKLIAERYKAWYEEDEKLNPTFPQSCYLEGANAKEKIEVIVRVPKNPKRERKKPSWIDPIWACVGKPVTKWNALTVCNENRTETLIPSNKDDALLIYVAALLILHDGAAINGAGLEIITENIWPKEQPPILPWASYFFETNDRTPFIESALMHVEADLASETAKEKALNASATSPKTDAATKQPITLKGFIEIYCVLTARVVIQSKVTLLQEYNKDKKITLPKLMRKYEMGRPNYYSVEDLKKNWPKYQMEMHTLPPLKLAGN